MKEWTKQTYDYHVTEERCMGRKETYDGVIIDILNAETSLRKISQVDITFFFQVTWEY